MFYFLLVACLRLCRCASRLPRPSSDPLNNSAICMLRASRYGISAPPPVVTQLHPGRSAGPKRLTSALVTQNRNRPSLVLPIFLAPGTRPRCAGFCSFAMTSIALTIMFSFHSVSTCALRSRQLPQGNTRPSSRGTLQATRRELRKARGSICCWMGATPLKTNTGPLATQSRASCILPLSSLLCVSFSFSSCPSVLAIQVLLSWNCCLNSASHPGSFFDVQLLRFLFRSLLEPFPTFIDYLGRILHGLSFLPPKPGSHHLLHHHTVCLIETCSVGLQEKDPFFALNRNTAQHWMRVWHADPSADSTICTSHGLIVRTITSIIQAFFSHRFPGSPSPSGPILSDSHILCCAYIWSHTVLADQLLLCPNRVFIVDCCLQYFLQSNHDRAQQAIHVLPCALDVAISVNIFPWRFLDFALQRLDVFISVAIFDNLFVA